MGKSNFMVMITERKYTAGLCFDTYIDQIVPSGKRSSTRPKEEPTLEGKHIKLSDDSSDCSSHF